MGVETQTSVYPDFIASELKAELDRKTAMDSRATSLVTTSGSLVTILAAVGAFVSREPASPLPYPGPGLLVVTLSFFVLAALAGICGGWPLKHDAPDTEPMRAMLRERWSDSEELASKEVVLVRISMIERLRKVNKIKVRWLMAGWISQTVALGSLSVVVFLVLVTD